SGTTVLSCSLTFAADLSPAQVLQGPTVTITAGPAAKQRNWVASIRLTSGVAKALHAPVLVSITQGHPKLVPNFSNEHVPTAGGSGAFGLSVRNAGNAVTSGPVTLSFHLPGGVRLHKLDAAGWRCSTGATSGRCTSNGPLGPGKHLPHLNIHASFARRTGNRTLRLTAHAGGGHAAIDVVPRHALVAVIKEPDTIAFDDEPLTRANEKL